MTRISPGPPLHRSRDHSQQRSSNDESPRGSTKSVGEQSPHLTPVAPRPSVEEQQPPRPSVDEEQPLPSVDQQQPPPHNWVWPGKSVRDQEASYEERGRPDSSGREEGWEGQVDGQEQPEGSEEEWRSTIGQTNQAWLHNQFGVPVGIPPPGYRDIQVPRWNVSVGGGPIMNFPPVTT